MGKGVGDDFRDGKMTLPVILAYARGAEDDRAFWRAACRRAHADDDLAHAIACCVTATRWPTRSSALAITAGARSMRWAPSPPARPSRR